MTIPGINLCQILSSAKSVPGIAYYFHANDRTTSQHIFDRSCGHSNVCCVVEKNRVKVIGRYPDQCSRTVGMTFTGDIPQMSAPVKTRFSRHQRQSHIVQNRINETRHIAIGKVYPRLTWKRAQMARKIMTLFIRSGSKFRCRGHLVSRPNHFREKI